LCSFAVKLPKQLPQNSFGYGNSQAKNPVFRSKLDGQAMGYQPIFSVTPTYPPRKKFVDFS